MVGARVSFDDLRGRFHADPTYYVKGVAAFGCDGAGARLRRVPGGGDAEPSPRPPSIYEAPRPREVSPEVDETIFIEGPRDVVHDHNLLPQLAEVLTTNVKTTTSHRLRNLEWRELSLKTTRDGVGGRSERSKTVPQALVPPEARARLPRMERPLLYS